MFNNRVCYRGSSEMSQIHTHWWHLLLVTVDFDDVSVRKYGQLSHTSMVCAIWGSSEKWQIWVQWSHFWRLLVTVDFDDSFNTKVWSVDHCHIHQWCVLWGSSQMFCKFGSVTNTNTNTVWREYVTKTRHPKKLSLLKVMACFIHTKVNETFVYQKGKSWCQSPWHQQ